MRLIYLSQLIMCLLLLFCIDTVANLTLMVTKFSIANETQCYKDPMYQFFFLKALGSSAPEILLSVIEIVGNDFKR